MNDSPPVLGGVAKRVLRCSFSESVSEGRGGVGGDTQFILVGEFACLRVSPPRQRLTVVTAPPKTGGEL